MGRTTRCARGASLPMHLTQLLCIRHFLERGESPYLGRIEGSRRARPPYDRGMPADAPVTRSSFHVPISPISAPQALVELPRRVWSDEEWERTRRGLMSGSMDEKWDVFAEGDVLFIHRSWTGYGIFEATFAPAEGGGWRIAGAVVERDPERYGGKNDERDCVLMEMVISGIVLGKPDPDVYAKWVELRGRAPGEGVPQSDAGPRGIRNRPSRG